MQIKVNIFFFFLITICPQKYWKCHKNLPSRPLPAAAHMKIACDNTVVRMVSSGSFVSRVSFSYRALDSQELQTIKLNNVEDFCFNN